MGLISKKAIIKWSGSNRKWYENKGYVYTKRDYEFEINVEDLMPTCKVVKVLVSCDDCKEEYEIQYGSYIKNINKNGMYLCDQCVTRLVRTKNSNRTKLLKSKSFEQWCIDNNRKDVINKWDYDLNDCLPSEVCYTSNKKYWFKCDKYKEHKSELKYISNFINGSEGSIKCNQCNSLAQYLIDNYGENALMLYWSDKNTLNPWKIDKSTGKKVWMKCQQNDYHDDYKISSSHFNDGKRCPYCSRNSGKIHPKDSLGQYIVDNYGQEFLNNVWSNKNEKSAFDYSPSSEQKVWWECLDNKHEDYKRRISEANTCEFRCQKCVQERNESFLQEKVRLYLEQINYNILHEYDCTIIPINPKTDRKLPFDNEIKELKLIIEVHGLQHYKVDSFHIRASKHNNTTPEYELHYQQLKDRYKRISAIQQGYFYLEIPYWTDNNKETWKQLIDNKLNEIKRKD